MTLADRIARVWRILEGQPDGATRGSKHWFWECANIPVSRQAMTRWINEGVPPGRADAVERVLRDLEDDAYDLMVEKIDGLIEGRAK